MEENYRQNHKNMNYMEFITVMYHKALFVIKNADKIKDTMLVSEEGSTYHLSDDSLKGYVAFKEHVDYTIKRLDPFESEFLENEFFHPNKNAWWSKMYSKSTYYRVKNRTVNRFLRLYHL